MKNTKSMSKKNNKKQQIQNNQKMILFRSIGMPRELIYTFIYSDGQTQMQLNNVGQLSVTTNYKINNLYDFDDRFSSGSPSNYNGFALFYHQYRVLSIAYRIEVTNLEDFPVFAVVTPTTTPGDISASSYYQTAEQPLSQSFLLGPKYQANAKHIFTKLIKLSDILGDPILLRTDPSYSGTSFLSAGQPTKIVYLSRAFECTTSSPFTSNAGVVSVSHFSIRARLYQPVMSVQ
jgi:hypothetical protein